MSVTRSTCRGPALTQLGSLDTRERTSPRTAVWAYGRGAESRSHLPVGQRQRIVDSHAVKRQVRCKRTGNPIRVPRATGEVTVGLRTNPRLLPRFLVGEIAVSQAGLALASGSDMRRKPANQTVDPAPTLERRAMRLLRRGDARKAAITLREAAALNPCGASYTRLGYALMRAGRNDEAVRALKEALYCFRHGDMRGRARTVARMILALDPRDATAQKRVA
jgi:tetratricopeptide (TPR) repeat protein